MELANCETCITVYLPVDSQGAETMAALRAMLARMKEEDTEHLYGRLEISCSGIREEDWANNWTQYFKPFPVGKKLFIKPSWEPVTEAAKGRTVLEIDPASSFGTGQHHTTRLCLELMESEVQPSTRLLDLGCGSGILSIAALRLGAASAKAVDIDDKCLTVAYENAALNGIGKDRYTVLVGDVLSNGALRETLGGGYDVVVANIVADVIIGLAPMVRQFLKPGGLFLCSGIIDTRAGEVADALRQNGWEIETTRSGEGWYSYACR